jgi:hypothetical protein
LVLEFVTQEARSEIILRKLAAAAAVVLGKEKKGTTENEVKVMWR